MEKDLAVIILDNCEQEPDVFAVNTNIFKNKKSIEFTEVTTKKLKSMIATMEVRSNKELMDTIKQSKIDKEIGNTRKYEEIARECGLRR